MNSGLKALDIVARLGKVNLDIRAVEREMAVPANPTADELLRIAKRLGFRARMKKGGLLTLVGKYPLPMIMGSGTGDYSVVLKVDVQREKALVLHPPERRPGQVDVADVDAQAAGYIVLTHREIVSQVTFGFGWFFHEILTYKRIIGEVLLGSFMVQLFGLVTPLFTQVILDKVIVHRAMSTLNVIAVAFLFIVVFELLLNISRNYIFIHTTSKLDAKLGAKLYRHLLTLPYSYFENRKVGNIAARVRELDTIRDFITNKAVSVIIDLFFSLTFIAVMLLYSVKLTLIVVGFVALIGILYLTITPELRRRLEEKFQMMAASNSYLVQSITGVQTVKSLAVEGAMQRKWEEHLARYVQSGFRLANMSNISGSLSQSVQKLMTISILCVGVKLVLEHQLTIGQLIAFQMFSGQFSGPVLRLVNLWNEFQQALLSVDRIGDILNHPVEIADRKSITMNRLFGDIRLDSVSFAYGPGRPHVLDRVTFSIDTGKSVGIVGRSGSGKSTVAKLIQRLYVAGEGALYIDDVDIEYMNPVWLRNNIGVVLQENYLFSGTIRDNLILAIPGAPMERVLAASKLAGAHEFISELPEGYDTMVGERGASLSGGQRQRVAIARALITDPPVLIFDEATSALDYKSERALLDNLDGIKRGRTTIFIAHRLSFIRDCDMIIVMNQGRVAEVGSHAELMGIKGQYYQLQASQH